MSKNVSTTKNNDEFLVNTLNQLAKELREMKTNQLRTIIAPRVASDPATLINGQIWYNTTSNQLKTYRAGAIVVLA